MGATEQKAHLWRLDTRLLVKAKGTVTLHWGQTDRNSSAASSSTTLFAIGCFRQVVKASAPQRPIKIRDLAS